MQANIEYLTSLKQDVRILSGALSNGISLKLVDVPPFLQVKIVHALFHSLGISPDRHTTRVTSFHNDNNRFTGCKPHQKTISSLPSINIMIQLSFNVGQKRTCTNSK